MNNVHAREFINSFVSKDRKDRYLALLNSKMGEKSLASHLAHLNSFNSEFIQTIPKDSPINQIYFVYDFINKIDKNIRKCYVISENKYISEKEMPIQGSIELVSGRAFSSIISFLPGKLAYYENESPGNGILFYKH